jgi:hypothetical protein
MNMHHVALIASLVALGMLLVFNAWAFWRQRSPAKPSDAFVAQLIPDDGSIFMLSCACLQGNVAHYLIEYGPNIGGPMCLNCARAEFVAWCLRQCNKRLAKHAKDGQPQLTHPPPPQTKQVQP